ncbi:MAG: hypothetical protein ABI675_05270 [Chitinophagaceae bacterium]
MKVTYVLVLLITVVLLCAFSIGPSKYFANHPLSFIEDGLKKTG